MTTRRKPVLAGNWLHAPVTRTVAIVVLLGALPVAALAASSVHSASTVFKAEARNRVLSASQLSSVAIRNEIDGVKQLVEAYAGRQRLGEALARDDRREVVRQLVELKRARPGIATSFVARMDGRLVDIVPSTPSIVGKDFSFRDWFKGVTRTRSVYVSEAYQSQAAGHPLVVAVTTLVPAPRGSRGEPVGILVAAYGLGAMQRLTETFAQSQGLGITLTDQRGFLLASPSAAPGLHSMRRNPGVDAALRGSTGVIDRDDDSLVAYQPVRGLGWAVTVGLEKRKALAALDGVRKNILGAAALLEILLLVGLGLLVRSTRARHRAERLAEKNRVDAQQAREQAERARDEAERANRAKSDFLSRMSHELRTPLNSVLGFAQLLELSDISDADRDNAGRIIGAGNHLLSLINEVLDVARIEAGKLSLSVEPVSVCEAVTQVVELISPIAAEQSVVISADEIPEGLFVRADRQRLKQILLNLLSNAVKYNRPGGTAIVAVRCTAQGRVVIEVTDTGNGIPEERLDELFVPFERLDADDTATEGTGLGLALAKGLTEAMGGELGVCSAPGHGSTFSVDLEATNGLTLLSAAALGDPRVDAGSAGHVLYIEDNQANVDLIERAFQRLPGVELTLASDGRTGLRLARQRPPDLVLLDLHLPDLDGEHVFAELRADAATATTPVIVLTADATESRRERLGAAGVEAYLTKPIDVQELYRLLGTYLTDTSRCADTGVAEVAPAVGTASRR